MSTNRGKLAEMLETNFGMKTDYIISPPAFQIGVTVTQVVGMNPNRLGLIIINMGAFPCYLSPENTVAVGAGILLAANGGSASLRWDVDFDLTAMSYFAIANGGACNCTVLEVVGI